MFLTQCIRHAFMCVLTQAVCVHRCKLRTIDCRARPLVQIQCSLHVQVVPTCIAFLQNVARQKAHLPLRNFVIVYYRGFIQIFSCREGKCSKLSNRSKTCGFYEEKQANSCFRVSLLTCCHQLQPHSWRQSWSTAVGLAATTETATNSLCVSSDHINIIDVVAEYFESTTFYPFYTLCDAACLWTSLTQLQLLQIGISNASKICMFTSSGLLASTHQFVDSPKCSSEEQCDLAMTVQSSARILRRYHTAAGLSPQ